MAIVRHLGRKHNLYGATEAEHSLVDVVIDAVSDLGAGFFKVLSSAEFKGGDKKELNALVEKNLADFAKLKKGKFIASASISIADFVMFNMLDNFVKPLAPEILAAHKDIEEYRASIAAQEKIAAYLASSRRPAITLPPNFGVLCTPDVCK
jgi:glutathione S-transferase